MTNAAYRTYREYLRHPRFLTVRAKVFERAGGLCEWCGALPPTEPHHAGDHGYAQLAPDRTALPLCAEHHRTGKDAAHGPLGKNFWKHHDIPRDEMIAALNSAYEWYNQLHV